MVKKGQYNQVIHFPFNKHYRSCQTLQAFLTKMIVGQRHSRPIFASFFDSEIWPEHLPDYLSKAVPKENFFFWGFVLVWLDTQQINVLSYLSWSFISGILWKSGFTSCPFPDLCREPCLNQQLQPSPFSGTPYPPELSLLPPFNSPHPPPHPTPNPTHAEESLHSLCSHFPPRGRQVDGHIIVFIFFFFFFYSKQQMS